MFQNSGLSLEQAPPIAVVLRFFLAGSLFGIAAGVWLLVYGVAAVDPADPAGLVLTHLLTIGVMLSFMLGALFQMLPVMAGVAMRSPTLDAIRTQWPMIAGLIFLLIGFVHPGAGVFAFAAALLGVALLPVALRMLRRLGGLQSHSPSSRGMGFALFDLILTVGLGLVLVGMRSGLDLGDYPRFRELHIAFGTLGWIALLIVSVSFQVIEMFYVTPPYPRWMGRYLPAFVSGALVADLVCALNAPALTPIPETLAALGLMLHGAFTLRRLSQRQRPLADATVWFWRLGMGALLVAMVLALPVIWGKADATLHTALALSFAAFALSVVFAMGYKIVPFLTWFHLNAQGYLEAPMMHEVVHPRYAMRHLWV
ncbi:hypothetical protein, partial [Nitratifractor sp.]